MTIIRPDSLPRLWWLFPWSIARQLHRNASALKALSDRLDQAVTIQAHVIADQSEEIANLRQHIRNLDDAIIRGKAITQDARPYHTASERLQDKAGKSGMSFEYRRNEDGSISAEAPHKPNLDV
jgi:hypothetical protein